jgi:hypothetical protein
MRATPKRQCLLLARPSLSIAVKGPASAYSRPRCVPLLFKSSPIHRRSAITFEVYGETSEMDALAAAIGVIFTISEDVAASARSRRGDIAPRCTQQNQHTRGFSAARGLQVTHNTYVVTPVTSANL